MNFLSLFLFYTEGTKVPVTRKNTIIEVEQTDTVHGAFICTLIKLNWVNILIYTQGCICLSIRGSVVVSLGWLSRSKIEILGIFRSLTKEEALPLNDSLILSYPLLPKFSMQHYFLPSFIYLIRLAKLASLRDVKTFFCRVTSRLLKSEMQFSSLHFISAFRNPTDTDFEINHGWECRNHLVSFIQEHFQIRSRKFPLMSHTTRIIILWSCSRANFVHSLHYFCVSEGSKTLKNKMSIQRNTSLNFRRATNTTSPHF